MQRVGASVTSIALLAILAMVNYLAFRHYKRFDWTSQGIYTLSPKSQAVLRELDKSVDIYVFLSRGESGFLSTDELLKRYSAASQNIKLRYVDPDREASQFKLLAQRFGIAAGVLESGEARADVAAVVALGEKNWHINREDLVASDLGPMGAQGGADEVQLKGEQALTGAIMQVTSGRPTKLCVSQGHGEWALGEGEERSLNSLQRGLHHDNLVWEAFETLGKTSVPEGCDAVLVIGPLHPFSDKEAKLLIEYVRGGGNLLLALDPVIEHDEIASTGFEGPLREVNIRLDQDLVIELDKERLLSRNPAEFVATEFGDHQTTRALQHSARVLLILARSVSPLGNSGDVEILLRASEQSFGKTNIAEIAPDAEPTRGASDIEGPVALALATQLKSPKAGSEKTNSAGGRLAVIGDSDFLADALLQAQELQNFHLASALIGWTSQRPALIEIPPKKIKSGNIMFSQDDMLSLFFRVVGLLPAAALVLGVAVWLNRRS
ncbi:MAG TPA: GldG family protein [Polyangiales bacterium]|nr:GldG family protein [Polyangiales bacterium]